MPSNDQMRDLLIDAADLTDPDAGSVRLVSCSVLDLLQQMEQRTGQLFSHAVGDDPPPSAMTVAETIEHCGIARGHDEDTRRATARRAYELLVGKTLPETHNPGPFIDDIYREGWLDSGQMHALMVAAVALLT